MFEGVESGFWVSKGWTGPGFPVSPLWLKLESVFRPASSDFSFGGLMFEEETWGALPGVSQKTHAQIS